MLSLPWRNRLFAAIAAILAVVIGWDVANGSLLRPVLCAGALAAMIVMYVQQLPIATLLLGGAIVGYVVGNRGFAQLSLAPNLPLLPAEFILLFAGAAMIIRSAQGRELPFRRDALNAVILLWMIVSSLRLYFDARSFGMMAVRDYALIYYAAFFFLGQEAGRDESARRFLWRCLAVSPVVLLVLYPLFVRFPDRVAGAVTIRGAPLIFLKADLAGTFMAIGAVMFFLIYETRRSRWALLLSLALIASTIATNNRASMLGLAVASLLLGFAGRWRFIGAQAIAGGVAAVLMLFAAYVENRSWRETPLGGVYERVISLTDPLGQRAYTAIDAADKGDNNRFRAVWWNAVFDEARRDSPWVGLGFGYDLAAQFVREYYPDAGDEFSTRSPHNVLLTIFARTGLLGFAPFVVLIVIMTMRTLRAGRHSVEAAAFWCAAWIVLCSACFGVVLEGPMGAVIFWTALGLANSVREPEAETSADGDAAAPALHGLPEPAPEREVVRLT